MSAREPTYRGPDYGIAYAFLRLANALTLKLYF
jgi:hypothetical protein